MYAKDAQPLPRLPWYKEFWAWFILTPLIVVIISCSIMVSLAFRHKDDVVMDNYYKEGRMINQRFEQDQRAAELGLEGTLRFDFSLGEVHLALQAHDDGVLPEDLLLLLDHPAIAGRDKTLRLQSLAPGRYRAELTRSLAHRWYVYVMPVAERAQRSQAQWRLLGELDFDLTDDLVLVPH
ncbi:FixH family protein [Exilibacterium tricleocarpae]|uniref:FixH family protein n=1 Tax=Exilibacterium tricleocarpae TaxID=2591008 RepID=A0A545U5K0_9GAMM|nr:FixH family protein [Exilibacterium tricleocarpae]TQV84748.1 FixH family protein [Exilibacterium tricleocarpae]